MRWNGRPSTPWTISRIASVTRILTSPLDFDLKVWTCKRKDHPSSGPNFTNDQIVVPNSIDMTMSPVHHDWTSLSSGASDSDTMIEASRDESDPTEAAELANAQALTARITAAPAAAMRRLGPAIRVITE
jgi:hypothetical protein